MAVANEGAPPPPLVLKQTQLANSSIKKLWSVGRRVLSSRVETGGLQKQAWTAEASIIGMVPTARTTLMASMRIVYHRPSVKSSGNSESRSVSGSFAGGG